MLRKVFIVSALLIASCASTPPAKSPAAPVSQPAPQTAVSGDYTLPDKHAFLQKDPRWSHHELGRSGDSLANDGCLVTATAMSLANLGFDTNPADLNARLTKADGFTKQGWLKWASISDVTGGKARAIYHTEVSDDIIQGLSLIHISEPTRPY